MTACNYLLVHAAANIQRVLGSVYHTVKYKAKHINVYLPNTTLGVVKQ
jgi:hypothetical protein